MKNKSICKNKEDSVVHNQQFTGEGGRVKAGLAGTAKEVISKTKNIFNSSLFN